MLVFASDLLSLPRSSGDSQTACIPVELSGWFVPNAQTNDSTPRDNLSQLQRLATPQQTIEAGSQLDGSDVEILTYAGHAGIMDKTKTVITRDLGDSLKKNMIAAATYRGRNTPAQPARQAGATRP